LGMISADEGTPFLRTVQMYKEITI
jgi:hypothetical protein